MKEIKLLEILDLNNLLLQYTNPLLNGIINISRDLIIVLTFGVCLETLINAIRNMGNFQKYIEIFIERIIKFIVLLTIINSARPIIDTSLRLFIEIGVAFGGDKSYIQSNNSFNFNYIWGQLGEIIGYIIGISAEFKGFMGMMYGYIILVILILSAVILIIMFSAVLTYYFVSVFAILTLPLNIFTPVSDLSKQVIKAWVISGLSISIFTVIMKVTVNVLKRNFEEFKVLNIGVGNNDLIGVFMFIILLGLIAAIFLSMSDISNFVLKGHGQGFTFNRIGQLTQAGINAAVNTALIALAVYSGGTSAAAAGAKETAKAGAEGASKVKKTFSDIKNAQRAARAGGNAVNKGISTATDSEHKENKGKTADNIKASKDLFKKGKGKK